MQPFIQVNIEASLQLLFFSFFFVTRRAAFADVQIPTWTTDLSDPLRKNQFCLFVGERVGLILSGATAMVQKAELICLADILCAAKISTCY